MEVVANMHSSVATAAAARIGAALSDAQYFESGMVKPVDIRRQLDTGSWKEKLDAMKRIVALVSLGKDASDFFPFVVKCVVAPSIELRKLVYLYLVHYAEAKPDLVLLSINTFQKDLSDSNQLIRALALRVLSSIRVPTILQIVVMAIDKCSKDSSPHVRKTAANAIPKVVSLEHATLDELLEPLSRLLRDRSGPVLGAAVTALTEVAPTRDDLLHAHFRKLCAVLIDLDEWSQISVVYSLLQYARRNLRRPAYAEAWSGEGRKGAWRRREAKRSGTGTPRAQATVDEHHATVDSLIGVVDAGGGGAPGADAEKPPTKAGAQPGNEVDSLLLLNGVSNDDRRTKAGDIDALLGDADVSKAKQAEAADSLSDGDEDEDDDDDEEPEDGDVDHSAGRDPDLNLLLRSTRILFRCLNSALCMSVVSLYFHLAAPSEFRAHAMKPLVRLLSLDRATQTLALHATLAVAARYPRALLPHVRSFFLSAADGVNARWLKIRVLTRLVRGVRRKHDAEALHATLLAELRRYVFDADLNVACYAVRALGCIADKSARSSKGVAAATKTSTAAVLRVLSGVVAGATLPVVGAEALSVMRRLLQRDPVAHVPVLRRLAMLLIVDKVSSPPARASIAWLMGEFYDVLPSVAPEMLRRLALRFPRESTTVKLQTLTLGAKLVSLHERGKLKAIPEDELKSPPKATRRGRSKKGNDGGGVGASEASLLDDGDGKPDGAHGGDVKALGRTVRLLFEYTVDMALMDAECDVRDRARLLHRLFVRGDGHERRPGGADALWVEQITQEAADAAVAAPESAPSEEQLGRLRQHFSDALLSRKPVAASRAYDDALDERLPQGVLLGSMSQALGAIMARHQPLARWTDTPTDASLRRSSDDEVIMSSANVSSSASSMFPPEPVVRRQHIDLSTFYEDEQYDDGEEDDTESDGDEDSEEEDGEDGAESGEKRGTLDDLLDLGAATNGSYGSSSDRPVDNSSRLTSKSKIGSLYEMLTSPTPSQRAATGSTTQAGAEKDGSANDLIHSLAELSTSTSAAQSTAPASKP